jgi:CBS domain-containing protein
MATVKEILAVKGSLVLSIDKDATVLETARFMTENRIGGVVVTEEGRFAGMFIERDLLTRVVAEELDPACTPVGAVMTTEVVCCSLDTSIEHARLMMRDRRIRHLPVVDGDGQLLGLISIGDLNAFQLADQEFTIQMLHEYLYGRV